MKRPVVLFSSAEPAGQLPAGTIFVKLPSDVVDGYTQPANSALHYTPYGQAIFRRNQVLIDGWREMGIREMYVDVSIEIALLAKLYGLTVGHAVMSGNRDDAAHAYGYAACDFLLACMAPELASGQTGLGPGNPNIHYVGGMSRYVKRPPRKLTVCRQVAVILSPRSEQTITTELTVLARHYPDTIWHCIGFACTAGPANIRSHGVVADPLPILAASDIVIGAGGANTIAEIASLGLPFVCVPEDRPYGEQVTAAQALRRLNAAVYSERLPTPRQWPGILEQMKLLDLSAWSGLVSDTAAEAAAGILDSAGRR